MRRLALPALVVVLAAIAPTASARMAAANCNRTIPATRELACATANLKHAVDVLSFLDAHPEFGTPRSRRHVARDFRWLRRFGLSRLSEARARLAPPPVYSGSGVRGVICSVFGPYCSQAVSVSSCETGGTFSTSATNGQYLGIFQMGSHERATYGDASDALGQARAAYRYFVASGRDWSPWSCKP